MCTPPEQTRAEDPRLPTFSSDSSEDNAEESDDEYYMPRPEDDEDDDGEEEDIRDDQGEWRQARTRRRMQ